MIASSDFENSYTGDVPQFTAGSTQKTYSDEEIAAAMRSGFAGNVIYTDPSQNPNLTPIVDSNGYVTGYQSRQAATKMNSDEFSNNYFETPVVDQMGRPTGYGDSELAMIFGPSGGSNLPAWDMMGRPTGYGSGDQSQIRTLGPSGGGSLGNAYIAPQSDYGQAADPTGALNLAAQTVTTNALAGGSLVAASGDVQPISAGEYGLNDFNQSLGLALGDTVRQVIASAGQVATNAVNNAGQRVVAKVNPSQKTSVANTPKPGGMTMTPTTMLVLAAVVVGVIVLAKGRSHSAA